MRLMYLKIKGLLANVNGLYVDQDFRQFELSPPPVTFPAALVSISMPDCEDLTDKTQRVRILITVRLGFNPFQDKTSSLFDVDTTTASLQYWDVMNGCYAALQSYYDDDIEEISRKSQIPQQRHDALTVIVQTFETYADDISALG